MIINVVWKIQQAEYADHTKVIFDFLMGEFVRILGLDCMGAEECLIFNDTSAPCPMLITNSSPIRIRLAQPALSYWTQTIFQLSHELCHYAIRQHKINKDFTLKWLEEIICEAASLYFLEYTYKNWGRCSLSQRCPKYSDSIKTYLDDECAKIGTDAFCLCSTIEQLTEYERDRTGERETHRNERNRVYRVISTEPDKLAVVCNYTKFLHDDSLTLDFNTWCKKQPCALLSVLQSIQPVKEAPNA